MRLQGKVALISGAARGMGAVEARMLAAEGAAVVVADLLDEAGQAVAAEIAESGGQALYVHLDVTDEAAWQRAVEAATGRFGKLDVLVNNAGIVRTERVLETTERIWDDVMSVNAKGVFLGTKAAIPAMRAAGGGSIVNISSSAGLTGSTQNAAYHASKGAVRIFTKAAAIQYAPYNIRVNSVHPRHGGHRHARRLARRGRAGTAALRDASGAHRQARRDSLRRALPRLGRVVVRDRQRAGDRRRAHGPVAEVTKRASQKSLPP